MNRNTDLDALRGWMLVSMTLTHLPTSLSRWANQPFGFVSNAEGFVFLSAYLVGRIYSRNAMLPLLQGGATLWRRALRIYRYHLVTVLFAFTVATWLALWTQRPAVLNLLDLYIGHPVAAVIEAVLLVYRPALMDILPMYVLFMIISPWLMYRGARAGWSATLVVSVAVWVAAQFHLRDGVREVFVTLTHLPVPEIRHLGAFNIYAWQLIWVGGVWLGQLHRRVPDLYARIPVTVYHVALAFALTLMVLRYTVGLHPETLPSTLRSALDKWRLGPLRMLDFAALTLICARHGHRLAAALPTAWLVTLGRASLPVFTVHVLACLLVLATLPDDNSLPAWAQGTVIAVTFALLYLTAATELRRNAERAAADALPRPQA